METEARRCAARGTQRPPAVTRARGQGSFIPGSFQMAVAVLVVVFVVGGGSMSDGPVLLMHFDGGGLRFGLECERYLHWCSLLRVYAKGSAIWYQTGKVLHTLLVQSQGSRIVDVLFALLEERGQRSASESQKDIDCRAKTSESG